MALNLSKDHTFTGGTTILSAQVNADFDELYNAFSGLEALTSSYTNLLVDTVLRSAGTIQSADGLVGAPGLTFTNDTDCGLYRVASNEIGVAIGGSLIGTWKSTGLTMNSLKLLGLSAGSAAGDSIRYEQVSTLWAYRRPTLKFASVTAVDVENNTGTQHETTILFPDGTYRSVTEDTSSTNKYRRFLITAAAEFTSGTEDSGLRSGITEATNTWYAIYAVKSAIDATKFVLAGDTTLPLQTNFSTLNSRYGTSGWVYLGMIRNGDNGGTTGDLLNFKQCGGMTIFTNKVTGGSTALDSSGLLVATQAAGTALAYQTSNGTGTTDIPANLIHILWTGASDSGSNWTSFTQRDDTAISYGRLVNSANTAILYRTWGAADPGFRVETASSNTQDIYVAGFFDSVLGVGPNPFL